MAERGGDKLPLHYMGVGEREGLVVGYGIVDCEQVYVDRAVYVGSPAVAVGRAVDHALRFLRQRQQLMGGIVPLHGYDDVEKLVGRVETPCRGFYDRGDAGTVPGSSLN